MGSPAAFFVCWTPSGEAVGGTGHAIRVASAYGIPVVNLAHGRRSLEEIANLLEGEYGREAQRADGNP